MNRITINHIFHRVPWYFSIMLSMGINSTEEVRIGINQVLLFGYNLDIKNDKACDSKMENETNKENNFFLRIKKKVSYKIKWITNIMDKTNYVFFIIISMTWITSLKKFMISSHQQGPFYGIRQVILCKFVMRTMALWRHSFFHLCFLALAMSRSYMAKWHGC